MMIRRLKTIGGRAVRRIMDAKKAEADRLVRRLEHQRRFDL